MLRTIIFFVRAKSFLGNIKIVEVAGPAFLMAFHNATQ